MNYYDEIKNELINNEINKRVKNTLINRNDLNTYYKVGKMLFDAGKHYGEGIIDTYSNRLTIDLGKGYSKRNLRNMRQFYKMSKKWQTLSAKLSWSYFCEIIWFDDAKFLYYIHIGEKENLSVRKLRERIKSNEYERLPKDFRKRINNKRSVVDYVKDPIVIKNTYDSEMISEKVLKELILNDIEKFMRELGNSFCFIGSEYKIRIGNSFNYIDLLLFNYEYNCFVVVELKVTELKKEHIGQVEVYMNYIDDNLKRIDQGKTVGIIICRYNCKYVIKYCSLDRIISREYELI